MLEPAGLPSPLETYMLVRSRLLLASSHGNDVQSQGPCVNPMCSAASPGSRLNFVLQGWEKTCQLPLLSCTQFSSLPSHLPLPCPLPLSCKRKFFQSPHQRLRQTHSGRKSCSFGILVGKRNGLMLKYPPHHVDTFLPPTWRVLSEQQGTPGSSAPAARSSAIRGVRSGASPLTLAVFNHTSVGSNRFSQRGKGCTR